MKKVYLTLLMLCMASLLFADSDRRAVDKIWTVVKNEFRRVKNPVKPASWQIYDSVHDARIGQNIAQKLKREFRIFEPTSPRTELSEAEKEMIRRKAAAFYPCKNSADIAVRALKEAEAKFPLRKKGDRVVIHYYRGGVPQNVEGVVREVRDNGTVYVVDHQEIRVAWIRKRDRKYFDPVENERVKMEFREEFIRDFSAIKEAYRMKLFREAAEKMTGNRKKGYYFVEGQWVSVKEIADALCLRLKSVTEKQHDFSRNQEKARTQSKITPGSPEWRLPRSRSSSRSGSSSTTTRIIYDMSSLW
ncbi:MAG: hypothetical protein IKD44_08530 [Lentisphaeria bacterium]|nr:hypothetical protein [Lentisphaeria bacterium]